MCGIFGFVSHDGRGPRAATLEKIAANTELRGPHSWGVAWIDPRGRLRMYKSPGRITDDLGRLAELTATKRELALDHLLDEDSTFYGDLFPHAVHWHGEIYLEDGLHRALRAALQQRHVLHARVHVVAH